MPLQIRTISYPHEAVEELESIFADLQKRFHDQWDWMDAYFYVEVLSSMATEPWERGPIADAIAKYRKRCPEAYKDNTDIEMVVSILSSAGLFGSMAARAQEEVRKTRERANSLRGLVKLADNLREAQKAYMADGGNEELGKNVGEAARAYDDLRVQRKELV